jgi:hypothetical protein
MKKQTASFGVWPVFTAASLPGPWTTNADAVSTYHPGCRTRKILPREGAITLPQTEMQKEL